MGPWAGSLGSSIAADPHVGQSCWTASQDHSVLQCGVVWYATDAVCYLLCSLL